MRPTRLGSLIALLVTAAALTACGSSAHGTASGTLSRAQAAACMRSFLTGAPARAVDGSAAPSVLAAFATLRRPHPLPSGPSVGAVLDGSGAVTYDPAHAAYLTSADGNRLYVMAAAFTQAGVPRACGSGSAAAYVREAQSQVGSGPGVCLLSISPGSGGDPAYLQEAHCASLTTIRSFVGGPSVYGSRGQQLELVPDGVQRVELTLPNGKQITSASATANLARLSLSAGAGFWSYPGSASDVTAVARQLRSHVPTTERVLGSGDRLITTYRRPASYLNEATAALPFIIENLGAATATHSSVTVSTTG